MNEVIETNLKHVSDIIRRIENEMDRDGSRFNIFSILDLSTDEVRLHSNFISELLNPKGTHTFKMAFLNAFLNNLRKIIKSDVLNSFNIETAEIEVEKWIGYINETKTTGGRIDIIISDKKGNNILIENKIMANDRPNQLLRYYNFNKSKFNTNSILLYLTLDGCDASSTSTNNKIFNGTDYYCISYEDFIHSWLLECMEISKIKPKVSETISQYANIIKKYTNQTIIHKMKSEIELLISSNRDFYNSIEDIYSAYTSFIQSMENKFWDRLNKRIKTEDAFIFLSNNTTIHYSIDDDGLFYYGFYVTKNDNKVDCTDAEFEQIVSAFKEIFPRTWNNHSHVCWIFSEVLTGFQKLGKEKIFEIQFDEKLDNLVDQIVAEHNSILEKVHQKFDRKEGI